MQNPTSTSLPSFPSPSHRPATTQDQAQTIHHSSPRQINQMDPSQYPHDGQYGTYTQNPDQIDVNMEEYDNEDFVPDSQGGEDYEGDFGDMVVGEKEGGQWQEGEGNDNHPNQTGHNQQYDRTQYYQPQDGAAGYRGPTPDSEHGEGALMLFRGLPQPGSREGERGGGRKEQYEVNQYATQDGMEQPGRGLQGYGSVNFPIHVEEPLSPLGHVQKLPHTHIDQGQPGSRDTGVTPEMATARARGQFVPPQKSYTTNAGSMRPQPPAHSSEHVRVEEIGGRRVLTRQQGKRKVGSEEEEEEHQARMEEKTAEAEKFDPTAEIVKFDIKKELVDSWDKIQAELTPYLRQYCEEKIQAMFDEILHVCNLFYQLNEDARKDLEEGVAKIEAEEKKQEACRKVIVDFSKQMQAVATVLSQFGGGAPLVAPGVKVGDVTSA